MLLVSLAEWKVMLFDSLAEEKQWTQCLWFIGK